MPRAAKICALLYNTGQRLKALKWQIRELAKEILDPLAVPNGALSVHCDNYDGDC